MSSLFHVHSTAVSLTCFVSVMVGDDGAIRPNADAGGFRTVRDGADERGQVWVRLVVTHLQSGRDRTWKVDVYLVWCEKKSEDSIHNYRKC